MNQNRRNPFVGMPEFSMETKKKNNWKYLLGFFAFILLHQVLLLIGYNLFVIMDNAFSAYGSSSPGLMWCLVGSLCGIIIGSIVAVKKFKLSTKINFLLSAPLALLLLCLFLSAGPLGQITPIPKEDITTVDSTQHVDTTATVKQAAVKRKKEPKVVKTKVLKEEVPPLISACEEETSRVSLTVRSDSVKLFFRIATVKGGKWSNWETVFIPQPGQYVLSGANGKVVANSIQYYYEIRHESTRSVADPFRKDLCSGILSIDTY